ncbi:ribonuclease H-like domain-containing protein [Tanacetum coccineum]
MANCKPSRTPVDTESKLGPEGVPVQDPTMYRSLAGGLQYLTFARLDLSYAMQQICLYMHGPREPHLAALKRVLRYHTLSRSSVKAEYRGVANGVAETAWLRNLLRELHSPLLVATLVYCDNVSARLEFYMYPPVISMPISSPRDCPRPCLKNFDPV